MKKQIKTMEQLKDSRLLYDKELPAFGYMLLLIIALSILGISIWGMNAHKTYVIISNGIVTNSNSSYVMSAYTGVIDQCYMEEGKLVQQGDVLFTIKSTDYNLQEDQLLKSKEAYEKQIAQFELLVKSIKDDTNYFDSTNSEDELYYSIFEAYKAQIAQNIFEGSAYQMYGYTDEQIESELVKNQGKISEIYYSAIQTAESSIEEIRLQIASIDAQLAVVEKGKKEYCVKAVNTGVLHLLADYKSGMVVQTGSAVATITPENSEVVIEAYVSTSDMARIEEGNNVQMVVDGLIQSVYGNISGVVIAIDSNATSIENEEGNNNLMFKIKVKPDIDYVVSKSGKKVNLLNGMTVETRIIYEEVSYFDYILEKLGFLLN